MHRAFEIAASGRPGPVVVDIPKNIQQSLYDFDPASVFPSVATPLKPQDEDIEQFRKMLRESERPCLCLGGGVISSGAAAKAVEFAEVVFDNFIAEADSKAKARKIVEEAIEQSEGHIAVLSQYVPWQEFILTSENEKAKEIQFVIFPSNRGGFNWQCVPDAINSFGQRKAVPEEWKGLRDEELQKVTGVETATFCHPAGFIGGAEKFLDAITLATMAVEAKG